MVSDQVPEASLEHGEHPGECPDERPRKRRPSRTRIAFRWTGIVLVVAVLGAGGYVWYNYQRFVSGITHIDAIAPSNAPTKDADGSDQNILLVGDDHRPDNATDAQLALLGTEQDGGATNTDTMMVVHIPADGSAVTLISFPRDSWVDIPGFGENKLNAAFVFGTQDGGGDAGGAQLLIQTIQNLSGLTIDHFVRVSLLGFYNIVDALGPVEVCLNQAVNDPNSAIDLPAGVSSLNAQQALAFVRQRYELQRGDLDRQVRQQYFLSVEARQILSAGTLLNPVKLQNVLDAVSSSIETDPGLNLISLATQLRGLNANNITTATIPISGMPDIFVGGDKISIVEVDMAAMPSFIASVIGNPSAYDSATAAAVGDVTVTVLNGSDTDGLASEGTSTLTTIGFTTGEPGSADTREATTIQYPAGSEAGAKALAAYVPGAVVTLSTTVNGVTLILGADGVQVTAPTEPSADAPPPAPAPDQASPAKNFASGACIN